MVSQSEQKYPSSSIEAENYMDGEKSRSNKKVRYVGVRQRPSGRWVAEIKNSSQKLRLWLGTFDKAEEAALAYDNAARVLRGKNAKTNFQYSDDEDQMQKWKNNLIGKVNPRVYQLLHLTIMKNHDATSPAFKSNIHGNIIGKEVGLGPGVAPDHHFDTLVEETIFCSSTTSSDGHHVIEGNKLCNNLSLANSKVYSSVVVAPSFSSSLDMINMEI